MTFMIPPDGCAHRSGRASRARCGDVVLRTLRTSKGGVVQRRTLGSLSVSVVGVGCNNFGARLDQAKTDAVVSAALDAGVNLFDTADIYGSGHSEEFLGLALASRRDEAVIATKFGMPVDDTHFGAAPHYVRSACEASLRRL